MSAAARACQLASVLEEMGLPSVRPDGVEWLFGLEGTRPFLDWICDNLAASNALSAEEAKRYHELKMSGQYLQGDALKSAMENMASAQTHEESVVALRKEVECLREELEPLKKEHARLLAQHCALQEHEQESKKKLAAARKMEETLEEESNTTIRNLYRASGEIDRALNDLVASAVSLSEAYADQLPTGPTSQATKAFLSGGNLTEYHEADLAYTEELRAFVDDQFNLVYQRANAQEKNDDPRMYKWLHTSSAEMQMDGETSGAYEEYCAELERLSSIYPRSMERLVDARVSVARAAAMVEEDRAVAAAGDSFLRKYTLHTAREEISRAEQRASRARGRQDSLRRSLASLLASLGDLQRTSVLGGAYDLKAARQAYYFDKQREVVSRLVEQRAWHSMLSACLVREDGFHRETHALLASMVHALKGARAAHNRSMQILQREKAKADEACPLKVYLDNLKTLCAPQGDANAFTWELSDAAASLGQLRIDLRDERRSADDRRTRQLTLLEEKGAKAHELLFEEAATKMPLMAPPELVECEAQLEETALHLKQKIVAFTREFNDRQKEVAGRPTLDVERNLFSFFFTDGAALLRKLEQLQRGRRGNEAKSDERI